MNRILSAVAVVCFSMSASAETFISSDEIAALPLLNNLEVVVEMPPGMAAVQPTGFVNFSYHSCAKQPFKAEADQSAEVLIIKVTLPANAKDCKGISREHQYSLQISSDMNPNGRVLVLNPQLPVRK